MCAVRTPSSMLLLSSNVIMNSSKIPAKMKFHDLRKLTISNTKQIFPIISVNVIIVNCNAD